MARRRHAAVEAAAQSTASATMLQVLARHQSAAARRDGAMLATLRSVAERNEAHRLRAVELRLTRALAEHADAERSRRMRLAAKQEAMLDEAFEQACRSERARLLADKSAAKLAHPKPAAEPMPPPPDFGPRHGLDAALRLTNGVPVLRAYTAKNREAAAERRARATVAECQLAEILSRMAADEEAAVERVSSDPRKVKLLKSRLKNLLLI